MVDWQIVQGFDLLGELAKSSSVETLRSVHIVFLFPVPLRDCPPMDWSRVIRLALYWQIGIRLVYWWKIGRLVRDWRFIDGLVLHWKWIG